MFSFDTPFSPRGLYFSLTSYQSFGADYVAIDQQKAGAPRLYVHLKWTKVAKELPPPSEADGPKKLAIGVDDGFKVDEEKFDIVKEHALVLLGGPPVAPVPLPCDELPTLVADAANAAINHSSVLAEDKAAAVAWEAEVKESKYAADLVQLPPTKPISANPADWVCEESGLKENLWLNLSDGHIGSGRRHYDGSGGANGALNHYEQTRVTHPPNGFPLVVKLGTITSQGADVYSYAPDEDTEVTDPKLAEHLAHWGINMMAMQKTELSVTELNIQANEKLELDKITEAGKELVPLTGPGFIGLRNLGNSCYMNSVLQILAATPEFGARFLEPASNIFRTAPEDPSQDVLTQMSKLATGLLTPAYATPQDGEGGECFISPRMFKMALAKGHQEFSSAKQQDALEYMQHLLDKLARAEHAASGRLGEGAPYSSLFTFALEEKYFVDGMSAYKTAGGQVTLSLDIPLEMAQNKADVDAYMARREKRQKTDAVDASSAEEEPVVPKVSLEACLAKFAAAEPVDSFRGRAGAIKTVKLRSFPKYLAIHMRRYYIDGWTPKKLSVQVQVPDEIDLSALRGSGPSEGEALLPDDDPTPAAATATAAAPAPLEPDEAVVAQLVSMGFSENGSKRAAVAVQNSNAEAAMEWVFAHMEDADFNDPLPPPGAAGGAGANGAAEPDAGAVETLASMGFSPEHAKGALIVTKGDLERAGDWLFSHMDNLDAAVAEALGSASAGGGGDASTAAADVPLNDGGGQYELLGFISHMGSNTACGHYVCHIKKENKWALFNDRKVAVSEDTPRELGYIYILKRKD